MGKNQSPGSARSGQWMRAIMVACACAMLTAARNDAAQPEVPLQELLQVLRTNLSGINPQELEQVTAEGLVSKLGDKVRIISSDETTNAPLVASSAVYLDEVGTIRIGSVRPGLAVEFTKEWKKLISSNRVAAVVIDLRNASGKSMEAAAETADLFLSADKPIFKAGDRTHTATKNEGDIALPIAILVNKRTSGAAEVLAGALRAGRGALVFGEATAGKARHYEEHTLSNGVKVEVAAGWIEFPNGQSIPESGLKPDLEVAVAEELEKTYLEEPLWGAVDRTQAIDGRRGSNTVSRRLVNEAELMRRQRGEQLAPDLGQNPLPSKPVIADPVLARSVDFLKGALVFHKSGPNR